MALSQRVQLLGSSLLRWEANGPRGCFPPFTLVPGFGACDVLSVFSAPVSECFCTALSFPYRGLPHVLLSSPFMPRWEHLILPKGRMYLQLFKIKESSRAHLPWRRGKEGKTPLTSWWGCLRHSSALKRGEFGSVSLGLLLPQSPALPFLPSRPPPSTSSEWSLHPYAPLLSFLFLPLWTLLL